MHSFHLEHTEFINIRCIVGFIRKKISMDIFTHVKASSVFYASVLKSLNSYADYRIFNNFVKSI